MHTNKRIGTVRPVADGNYFQANFRWENRRYRLAVVVNGVTIPAFNSKGGVNQQSLRYCERLLEKMGDAMIAGKFVLRDFFPHAKCPKGTQLGTVKEELCDWLRKNEKKLKSPRSYRVAVNAWCESAISSTPVLELTGPAIQNIIEQWQLKGNMPKTLRNKLIPLNSLLDSLVRNQRLARNPIDFIAPETFRATALQEDKAERMRDEVCDPFDKHELEVLFAAARGNDPGNPMHNMIRLWAWTGLRPGEIFAIAWEDVDFNRRQLLIQRSFTEGKYGRPKTASSRRIINFNELAPDAWQALLDQRAHTLKTPRLMTFGDKPEPRRFIFLQDNGGPFTDDEQFRRTPWKNLIEATRALETKVRYRAPKHLRHTFASLAIAAGEDREWIRRVMGHETTAMIEKHYGDWLEQAAKAVGRNGGAHMKVLASKFK